MDPGNVLDVNVQTTGEKFLIRHTGNDTMNETLTVAMLEVLPFVGSLSAFHFVLLSLATALSLVVVSFALRKSKSRGHAFLLVGPSDSGKTAILSNLAYNQTLPSHTSLQTNSAQMRLTPTKTLRVVDVPGHPRIRDQFREHLKEAKAIAFVVDCSTISRNGSAVAEHLHHLFHAVTSLPPMQSRPTLVILAHKTDLLKVGASSSSVSEVAITRVRSILERELEKRRVSQSGGVGVESLGADGEGAEMGGLECGGASGGVFKFNEWEGGDVEFVSTWVSAGDTKDETTADGLDELREWLGQQ